jgi:hypothetical protein
MGLESALSAEADFRAADVVGRGLYRGGKLVAGTGTGPYRGFASVSNSAKMPLSTASRFSMSDLLRKFVVSRRAQFTEWVDAMPAAEVDGSSLVFWVARPLSPERAERYATSGFVREF